MKAVVVGNGASAHIEYTDGFVIRLRALEMMLDGICGRPRQVNEITGADGDAIEVRVPNDEERELALAAVVCKRRALSIIPQNPSASAPTTDLEDPPMPSSEIICWSSSPRWASSWVECDSMTNVVLHVLVGCAVVLFAICIDEWLSLL